jgi:hypothetical protein
VDDEAGGFHFLHPGEHAGGGGGAQGGTPRGIWVAITGRWGQRMRARRFPRRSGRLPPPPRAFGTLKGGAQDSTPARRPRPRARHALPHPGPPPCPRPAPQARCSTCALCTRCWATRSACLRCCTAPCGCGRWPTCPTITRSSRSEAPPPPPPASRGRSRAAASTWCGSRAPIRRLLSSVLPRRAARGVARGAEPSAP